MKSQPRDSQRDARRGRIACDHGDTPTVEEVGCLCLWGCYIGQGEKAKPLHIRMALDWRCLSDHGMTGQSEYRVQLNS